MIPRLIFNYRLRSTISWFPRRPTFGEALATAEIRRLTRAAIHASWLRDDHQSRQWCIKAWWLSKGTMHDSRNIPDLQLVLGLYPTSRPSMISLKSIRTSGYLRRFWIPSTSTDYPLGYATIQNTVDRNNQATTISVTDSTWRQTWVNHVSFIRLV